MWNKPIKTPYAEDRLGLLYFNMADIISKQGDVLAGLEMSHLGADYFFRQHDFPNGYRVTHLVRKWDMHPIRAGNIAMLAVPQTIRVTLFNGVNKCMSSMLCNKQVYSY